MSGVLTRELVEDAIDEARLQMGCLNARAENLHPALKRAPAPKPPAGPLSRKEVQRLVRRALKLHGRRRREALAGLLDEATRGNANADAALTALARFGAKP